MLVAVLVVGVTATAEATLAMAVLVAELAATLMTVTEVAATGAAAGMPATKVVRKMLPTARPVGTELITLKVKAIREVAEMLATKVIAGVNTARPVAVVEVAVKAAATVKVEVAEMLAMKAVVVEVNTARPVAAATVKTVTKKVVEVAVAAVMAVAIARIRSGGVARTTRRTFKRYSRL
jgi:hypothetical protein